jgi:sec-independent protein translocase protein TatB
MPTIGWFEILIVAAVAIVVIGPKDFPFMLKKAGSWIGTIKKYINNLQNEVNDLDLNSINTEEPKIKIKIKNKDKDNDKI